MKKLLILSLTAAFFCQGLSQTWLREDYANTIMRPQFQAKDGNVVCAQFHNNKISVIKIKAEDGSEIWNYEYAASRYSEPAQAVETADQGILIVGADDPGLYRNYVLWTDKDGKRIADTVWIPMGMNYSRITGVIIDSADSTKFVCSGWGFDNWAATNRKYYAFVTKLQLQNKKIIIAAETTYPNFASDAVCKTNNGYIIIGTSTSTTFQTTAIALTPDLKKKWEKNYSLSPRLAIAKAIPTNDGYIFAGWFFQDPGAGIAKINSNGDLIWSRKYIFAGTQTSGSVQNIWQTDNGFKAVIELNGFTANARTILAIINGDGNIIWAKECLPVGYVTLGSTILNDGTIILGGRTDIVYPFTYWMARQYFGPTEIEPAIPTEFKTSVYPNPFNSTAKIQFELPETSQVQILILDLLGREIWTRQKNLMSSGTHFIVWNGTDHSGQMVGNGIYFIRIRVVSKTKNLSATQKVTLMK